MDSIPEVWAQETAPVPEVNQPPSPECVRCGLYATCKSPAISVLEDSRLQIGGKSVKSFPLVMVVGPGVSKEEDTGGCSLAGGFISEMLLDYLSILEARWVYVPLVRCFSEKKPGVKQVDICSSAFLSREIEGRDPAMIVTLGKEALERLWPGDMGKAPSIFKARTMPTQLASGRWLLAAYDPNSHRHYLETDGKRGQDLSTEYPQTFSLVDQILSGNYSPERLTWDRIQTQDEIEEMLKEWRNHSVQQLCIDMEDDTFCGHSQGWRPYKDPHPGLPGKYTRWHPDNRLLDFGVCALLGYTEDRKPILKNYAINVALLQGRPGQPNQNVTRMLQGKTLIGWNIKVEVQDVWLFTGYDMIDPANGNTLEDGMIMRALRDQSLIHNGLKPTAQELYSCPDWSHKIWQELHEAKAQNAFGTSSMGDCNPLTREEYNIGDVYWNMRLFLEKLPETDYSTLAYRELIDGIPFVAEMERVGLPFRADIAEAVLSVYEGKIAEHEREFRALPEFLDACSEADLDPEHWTPKKKKWWAAFLGIFGLKTQVGTTATGMLSQDAETVRHLAGEGDETGVGAVPWGSKTRAEKVFTILHRLTKYQDDVNKYRYYLDYVIPAYPGADIRTQGRIHPDYYIIKAETENLGNNTNNMETGGAVSGRFSRTPPQNANNNPIFLSPYVEEPGWGILEVDYTQAEMVWIAENCKDELLSKWVCEGANLHLRKGALLFTYQTGRPEEDFWAWRSEEDCKVMDEIHPEQKPWRRAGKTDNFAFAFLQEPETIARTLGITVEEAYEIGRASDALHPNIRAKKIEVYEALNRGEKVYTHLYLRPRSCPMWVPSSMSGEVFFSWDPDTRNKRNSLNVKLFKSIWNTVVAQADSSDCTFHMGKRTWRRILQDGILDPNLCRPMEFVHDAVKWKVREDYVSTAAPVLVREMEDLDGNLPIPFPLPLRAKAEFGPSMGRKEKIHL